MLNRLKIALESKGLTSGRGFYAKLAKDTGYSSASMSVAFNSNEISDKLLRAICTTYGINEDWVKNGTGEPLISTYDRLTITADKVIERMRELGIPVAERATITDSVTAEVRRSVRTILHKKESGLVFPSNYNGKQYSDLKRALDYAEKITGIHMTPHMFRHMSATALYEATGDIMAVSQHLRHSTLEMSKVYTRYSQARSRQAVSTIFNYFANDSAV